MTHGQACRPPSTAQSGNPERSVDLFVREPFAMAELQAEALTKDLDGVPSRIASIRHLIAMKQAAGCRHDLDDIEALRQIAAETGQPDGGDP